MKKAPQWDLIQNSTQALRCDPLPALQTSHQYEACALKLVFVYHLESVSLVCSRQATVVHLVPTNLREQVAQFCCKIRRQAIYIYIQQSPSTSVVRVLITRLRVLPRSMPADEQINDHT